MVIYAMQDYPMFGTMQQGFMSELQNVVGAIAYGLDNGAKGLRIDFESPIYTDRTQLEANWWAYFFDPVIAFSQDVPPQVTHYNRPIAQETHYNRPIARFGLLGSFGSVQNGKRAFDWPYPLPMEWSHCGLGVGCGLSVQRATEITKTHIHPRPWVQLKIEEYVLGNFAGRWVIGVHYRGTDKVLLWPYSVPSYKALGDEIDRVKAEYVHKVRAAGGVPQEVWVYMATDERQAMRWVQAQYPGRVLSWAGSRVIQLEQGDATAQMLGSHKTASGATAFQKGESVVLDTYILGRVKHLIKNKSSVSDVAMQLLDKDAGCTFLLTDELSWEFRGAESRQIAHPLRQLENLQSPQAGRR